MWCRATSTSWSTPPEHRPAIVDALAHVGASVERGGVWERVASGSSLPWTWGFRVRTPFRSGRRDHAVRRRLDRRLTTSQGDHRDAGRRLGGALHRDEGGGMSAATGLSDLDVAILEALAAVGATPGRPFVKSQLVVDAVYERTGIGPNIAYEPLCDLARPWVTHLQLLTFHGNLGSIMGFGPADPAYTECRLSPLGAVALAAERGERGPLPIGLINGDIHGGGRRPPFDSRRVVAAIQGAAELTDDEIVAAVGLPSFPSGCMVTGDLTALAAAQEVDLVMSAGIDDDGADRLVITRLPPGSTHDQIGGDIEMLVEMHGPETIGVRDVFDESTSEGVRLVVQLRAGAGADAVRVRLRELWSVQRPLRVRLPRPLATTIRRFGGADLAPLSE
jgi:hypothetical protein